MRTETGRTHEPASPRPKRHAIRCSLFALTGLVGFAAATALDGVTHAHFATGTLPAVPTPVFYLLNAFGVAGLWLTVALGYLLVDGLRARFRSAERTLVRAAAIVVPVFVAGLAGEALKIVVRRERPLAHGEYVFRSWGPGWENTRGLGMPSTHAAVAFAAAAALSRLHRRGRYAWHGLALGCVYTRLQPDAAGEAAHFLSDVVVGAAFGWLAERMVNRELVDGKLYADAEPRPVTTESGAPGGAAAGGADASLGPAAPCEPLSWMTWPATIVLAATVLVFRVIYLRWLCAYELSGAEAALWNASRELGALRLDADAALAHLIAVSAGLFGAREWAVRLPAAICAAIATLAIARLATRAARGDERVGFLAAAMFTLIPAFQANAQSATSDGLLLACVLLGGWALLAVTRRIPYSPAAWSGALLCLGALAGLPLDGPASALPPGSFAPAGAWTWLLALNPPLLMLAAAAALGAASSGLATPGGDRRARGDGWMLGLAAAALVAGTVIAWHTGRASLWLQLAYLPFIVMTSFYGVPRLVEHRSALAAWRALPQRPRPWLGRLRRRPETSVSVLWDWTIICGVVGWLVVSLADTLATTSLLGPWVGSDRFGDARERGSVIGACARAIEVRTGRPPLFMAEGCATAGLAAFYIPGQPAVLCLEMRLADAPGARGCRGRMDAANPAPVGRDIILIGASRELWTAVLDADAVETLDAEHGIHVAWRYRGLRPSGGA